MNRGRWFFIAGILSILLLLVLAGCGVDALKGSPFSPQKDTSTDLKVGEEPGEEESLEEPVVIPTENPETNCSSINPHPMAEGMAVQFEISYDQIMTWYCDGAAFSDILLALETEELVDLSVEELLSKVENKTWEEIWQELDVNPQ